MPSPLQVIRSKLASATTFAEIFGSLPKGDAKEWERHLKAQYRTLVRMTHPDQVEVAERALANSVFPEVVRFYERATAAAKAGHYDEPVARATAASPSPADVILTSATTSYTIGPNPWALGDFSNLHLGRNAAGLEVLVKVASGVANNSYLAHEATFLRRALSLRAATGLKPYLPELLDSLTVTEAGNEQYRVNVFRYKPGYVSLTDIHLAYPKGLDPKDAAWIWRRLIAQALSAEVLGVVHGAIVPDHLLVHPETHEPLHIGWVHSVERPQERQARITTVIDRFRDWYPPEIFARAIPSLQTDLYMVGKTMIYLAGGDVARNRFPSHYPPIMKDTVARLVAENPRDRPTDGHALLREFTTGIRSVWGTKFRPLSLPK